MQNMNPPIESNLSCDSLASTDGCYPVHAGCYPVHALDALEGSFALNLIILVGSLCMSITLEGISLLLDTPLCHHSTRNIYWHPCLSAGRCDWHHSMPQKEVHRHEKIHNGKQTFK